MHSLRRGTELLNLESLCFDYVLESQMAVLVDAKRLRPIQDLHTYSPDCMVAADDSFELTDEFLLITDPIHLG
jgi:hypothetical protein